MKLRFVDGDWFGANSNCPNFQGQSQNVLHSLESNETKRLLRIQSLLGDENVDYKAEQVEETPHAHGSPIFGKIDEEKARGFHLLAVFAASPF